MRLLVALLSVLCNQLDLKLLTKTAPFFLPSFPFSYDGFVSPTPLRHSTCSTNLLLFSYFWTCWFVVLQFLLFWTSATWNFNNNMILILGIFYLFIFKHVYYIHHAIRIYLGMKIPVNEIPFCHCSSFLGGLLALLSARDFIVFISCYLLSCLEHIIFCLPLSFQILCDLHLWL